MAERPGSQGLPGELILVPDIKFHHGAQRQGLSRRADNMATIGHSKMRTGTGTLPLRQIKDSYFDPAILKGQHHP
ncbi:rCG26265 [Rattus norvegicus]|uniref:RCG26265 n=1 Tax=Rattus norvegicus TaxID=10116 RepID=A6HN65_RAT|nr:rCG26265 [Rattus norvegicus]